MRGQIPLPLDGGGQGRGWRSVPAICRGAAVMEPTSARTLLSLAGVPAAAISPWLDAWPDITGAYHQDAAAFSHFWRLGGDLLAALPAKPARTPPQAEAAAAIIEVGRETRDRFLAAHVDAVYRALTSN